MGAVSTKSRDQLVTASIIVFLLSCLSENRAEFIRDFDIPFTLNNIDEEMEALKDFGTSGLFSSEKLDVASDVLAKLLLIPWPKGGSPIVYVEKSGNFPKNQENELFSELDLNDIESDGSLRPIGSKRSKYYRKYPWKRQQNMRYEPAYVCVPKKDDVYRLLVAIHGERDGYKGQMVDFCNRRRPASLVFTNIRYVG